MYRLLSGGVLTAVVALGIASSANAGTIVQRSGDVYYKAACASAVGAVAHCHAKIVTDKEGNILGSGRDQRITGYAPADLRQAYNVTANGSSSTLIAIVDAFGYDNAESDLGVYRAQWGLPACTTANGCFKKLNENGEEGNYPPQDIGWAQESALDLDMASAMCPNCTIYLIEGTTNSFRSLGRAELTAAGLGAHVISNSYGAGEFSQAKKFEKFYKHKGIAVTVSTGDDGYGVQYPASSPHVIAVGGTRLTRDGSDRGFTETAWSGAGSGCSTVFRKPKWQHDTDCELRTVADVSAEADPATGVAVYGPNGAGNSVWLRFGGTSVAAPLIGGIYGANGGKVKWGSNPYGHTDDLYDVVSGSNGSCGGSYLCTAGPGYDGPTGLGTPNGINAF
jgi:subtilase family serine protease